MMNKVITLLSNEDLLIKNGINGYSEVFLIENMLMLIGNREKLSPDCDLYILESNFIWILKKIENNPLYNLYTERIRNALEITPITEEIIDYLKEILEEMLKDIPLYILSDIVVKKMI